jgi:hypothetical protein
MQHMGCLFRNPLSFYRIKIPQQFILFHEREAKFCVKLLRIHNTVKFLELVVFWTRYLTQGQYRMVPDIYMLFV